VLPLEWWECFVPLDHPLVRAVEAVFALTPEEHDALLRLPMQVERIRADQDIVREHDRPTRCCLVLEGFAATYKVTPKGKRQIMAFHIPGDVPDMQSVQLELLDMSLGTITPCKVGFIRPEAVNELCERHFRIARAFWRQTLIDAAIFREWVVNVGRRDAYSALAHLLCELVTRMRAVGLANGDDCIVPQTQAELGDALGISTVHVNRTLMELRGAGLIKLSGAKLTVLDWEGLKRAGEFDPTYLHLRNGAAL
jgi:CRP-like cAMP-binding protein